VYSGSLEAKSFSSFTLDANSIQLLSRAVLNLNNV
jgi:hypothetical protein